MSSSRQTILNQVLPAALPRILIVSRAIGETVPLVMIGALTYVAFMPGYISSPADFITNLNGIVEGSFGTFTALAIWKFNWVSRLKTEYLLVAAAGILVLLVVLLVLNRAAISTRHRFQKRIRW